jgi:hypothetical protein
VDAALRIKASYVEAVIARDDGTPDFRALRSKRRGHEAVLYAFDLIEHDGDDHLLRNLPKGGPSRMAHSSIWMDPEGATLSGN